MYASLVAAMGQEGADVARMDAVEKDTSPPRTPTIAQRLAGALDVGVRLEVCEQTVSVRKIKSEDPIPEARLIGGASLIDYVIRARGALTF